MRLSDGCNGCGSLLRQEDRLVRMYKEGRFLTKTLREDDGSPFGLKYKNFPVARLCHMLPAPIWAVLAPIQLSATIRQRFCRVHRVSGRVFMTCSTLIAIGLCSIGLCSIIKNRLTFYTAGFWDLVFLSAMNAWFVLTGACGVARARRSDIRGHHVWMLRHCACGYFVFLQRTMVLLTRGALMRGGFDLTVSKNAKAWFHVCALVAAAISVTAIEVWLAVTSASAATVLRAPSSAPQGVVVKAAAPINKRALALGPRLDALRTPLATPSPMSAAAAGEI
ncbi:hypothetical protein JKP88DRAFT_240637 [Tribonema minus]|uniref:Uncharacterized protein n=1 Tax=Tribonema minus TaxID=303371 RepID=A0A836CPM6_9STRA|nr:hypothetical protein JKP88DRAFT_240637 [Tribonema minus]